MSEPRFERNQLGEVLRRAAELQEGRADPDAADRLALRGLKQMADEAETPIAGPPPPAPARWKGLGFMLTRLRARMLGK